MRCVGSLNFPLSRVAARHIPLVLLWCALRSTMMLFTLLSPRSRCVPARGEFNFQIADQSHVNGVLSEDNYAAVTWALLIVTLLTPLWFRVAFRSPPEPSMSNRVQPPSTSGAYHDVRRWRWALPLPWAAITAANEHRCCSLRTLG